MLSTGPLQYYEIRQRRGNQKIVLRDNDKEGRDRVGQCFQEISPVGLDLSPDHWRDTLHVAEGQEPFH